MNRNIYDDFFCKYLKSAAKRSKLSAILAGNPESMIVGFLQDSTVFQSCRNPGMLVYNFS